MMRRTFLVIGALALLISFAPVLDDGAAQELDDATVVTTPDMAAGGADDADADAGAGAGLVGAQATAGPLAFGVVTANGTKWSGTPNFSSSYNPTYRRYEISIQGQNYYYLSYATIVTPAGDARFCKSSSVGGKLLVYCYDANGQVQPSRFGFITFRQ